MNSVDEMQDDDVTVTGGAAHDATARDLANQLGMPPDAPTGTIRMRGRIHGPQWVDYQIEIVGQFLDQETVAKKGHFLMRWSGSKDAGPFRFEGWRLRLTVRKVKPYLEIQYHPELTTAIRNLDNTTPHSHVRRLLKGRELVMTVDQSDHGRPLGSGIFEDESEFRQRVEAAFIHCENEDERPTLERIAALVGVGVTTLKEYKKKWPQAWPRR